MGHVSLLSLLIFQISCINCLQLEYKFIPDHCEVTNVNASLVTYAYKKCIKLSRTELYLNQTFVYHVDILSDRMGQMRFTGYQFRSNEYRKGPIEFMLGMCSGLSSDQYDMPNMMLHSNFRCPIYKGHNYYTYNIAPNATNMPPLIPEGQWMFEVEFIYMNKYLINSIKWVSLAKCNPDPKLSIFTMKYGRIILIQGGSGWNQHTEPVRMSEGYLLPNGQKMNLHLIKCKLLFGHDHCLLQSKEFVVSTSRTFKINDFPDCFKANDNLSVILKLFQEIIST